MNKTKNKLIKAHRFIGIVAITCLVTISLVFVGSSPANADLINEEECFPAVLMLRGSGEQKVENITPLPAGVKDYRNKDQETIIRTNGYEGSLISGLLKKFALETKPADTVSKTRFIGIDYPAAPVFPSYLSPIDVPNPSTFAIASAITTIGHLMLYNDSYRQGAENVVDFIEQDKLRGCSTQYMLVSYSQGVIAARLAMNLMDNQTDTIISSYVIGDPFQKGYAATTFNNQITSANTSSDTSGIGHVASTMVINAAAVTASANPLSPSWLPAAATTLGLTAYRNEIEKADPLIYHNDNDGTVSRSLCHAKDPTCSFSGYTYNLTELDINAHTNYFSEVVDSPGPTDILKEVPQFDAQVKTLADSAPSNPRDRKLVKLPLLSGATSSYRVSNARIDDICSWDKNSDGIGWTTPRRCDILNTSIARASEKMTVKVTDSFGTEYVYSDETAVIDTKSINDYGKLTVGEWYQFKPYNFPEKCIGFEQDYNSTSTPGNISVLECNNSANTPEPSNVFKLQAYAHPQLGATNKLIWGYDDDYYWSPWIGRLSPEMYVSKVYPGQNLNSGFTPFLNKIIDGVPYYSFRTYSTASPTIRDNKLCLSFELESGGWNDFPLIDCDSNSVSQLFEANIVTGDFGSWSINKDVTPPTPVTGIQHETLSSNQIKLSWNPSTDGRNVSVIYKIYKVDNLGQRIEYVNAVTETQYIIDLQNSTQVPLHYYEIVAVDYKGLESTKSIVTFPDPRE